ncbi:hypothetical protein CNMCM8686_000775 [Aspergillus fumigatus]|nr:hypothetical protein CNMCM8686_000775 [Aspergillus fumigatus]
MASPPASQGIVTAEPAPNDAAGFLSEADSLALLAGNGLAVIEHAVCRTADEAIAAWRRIGAPVALKACSAQLPHKSEHGLPKPWVS